MSQHFFAALFAVAFVASPHFGVAQESADRQNSDRFQRAYALIQKSEYKPALKLLQQNISETPNAGDIDYAYGWAVLCAAHLDRIDLTLQYYRVIRTRFVGLQSLGAGGAHRMWEGNLKMARQALAARLVGRQKENVLKQLDKLDNLGRETAIRKIKELIKKAQQGDQIALQHLRSGNHLQPLIDLIEQNRLKLVD